MMTPFRFYVIGFTALLALTWIIQVKGCHNKASGEDGDDDEDNDYDSDGRRRKKRQAPTVRSPVEQEIERTRQLRDYFVACLQDEVGDVFDWNSVVDYSILDTRWFDVTDADVCSNDTVSCWEQRLSIYLRPDSNLKAPTESCIEKLSEDVNTTGQLVYRRRTKRAASGYRKPLRRKLNPDQVQNNYANCVQQAIELPRNRRPLSLDSVVEFIEVHAFCGECGVRPDPILPPTRLRPTRPQPSLYQGYNANRYLRNTYIERETRFRHRTSNGRKKRSSSTGQSASTRYLSQSFDPTYTPTHPSQAVEAGSSSSTVYPFIFVSLTEEDSPLINPIANCNERFSDVFIPENPCENLRNFREEEFCEKHPDWCDILKFRPYMTTNCARTCCERNNTPVGEAPIPGWTEWSPWGECPAPCGQRANQVRRRTCPLGVPGISPCDGADVESRSCEPVGCPLWGEWSTWSPCQITCGTLNQFSRRRCINGTVGEVGCRGPRSRNRQCDRGECFGTFTAWTSWSPCSVSCGGSSQQRRRACEGEFRCLPDEHGIATRQSQKCNTNICPGRWTQWGPFNQCEVTCGGNDTYRRRTRRCIGGEVGALGCEGLDVDRQKCGRDDCPEPEWGDWASWSNCNWRRRVRKCLNGPPGACPGENTDFGQCKGCNQVRAHWGAWWHWSVCEGICRGVRQRKRMCVRGTIGNPGCPPGRDLDSQNCIPPVGCYPGK